MIWLLTSWEVCKNGLPLNKTFLDSTQVQVDEAAEKVRPASKRCTIILRRPILNFHRFKCIILGEIPEDANEAEVKAMFDGCPSYQTLSYAGNCLPFVFLTIH